MENATMMRLQISITLLSLLALSPIVSMADEKFDGDFTVNGTLSARAILIGAKPVATTESLEELRKEILGEIVKEITRRLQLNINSPELRAFGEEITNRITRSLKESPRAANALEKQLGDANRSWTTQIAELKRSITTLESESRSLKSELSSLKREVSDIKKDLERRR